MKIVILDGYTVNPGDLNWKPIERIGECKVYDRTSPEKTLSRSKDAEIIITSKVILDREILNQLPELKYVGIIATGYNMIDLDAAREKNITVTNVPNYCSESVAQMVFAHILELVRHVDYHSRSVKEGRWGSSKDFCYWDYPQIELTGKILGVVGCGSIGKAVARIANGFKMRVISYDVCKPPVDEIEVEFVDVNTLFKKSDIVSLHCPLTPSTEGMINKSTLSMMKKNAYLINTSRGPLVNENDLAEALNQGTIAGAGLDVLSVEPPPENNPLLRAKNCLITPHIAWASLESRERLIELTAKNIRAFLDGNPINVLT